MVKVCEDTKEHGESKGFYMDGRIKENLDYELKRVDKKWDSIILYDGEEGAAKTTLACANAYYMAHARGVKFNDDKENNNHIIYTSEEFKKVLDTAKPYTNIVWDEFVMEGLSDEAGTKRQALLIKKMAVMRSKRLIVHLIAPYMFMLRKYFVIGRTRCLFHVYSHNNLDRGDVMYFSKPGKRYLYINGVKYWDYNKPKADFVASFTNTFGLFFDINTYEAKKAKAMESIEMDRRGAKAGKRIATIIQNLLKEGHRYRDVCRICDFKSEGTIHSYLKKYNPLDKGGLSRSHGENNGTTLAVHPLGGEKQPKGSII